MFVITHARLENVTKTFGDVVAAKDINIEISEGELVVLLGPSGCGKTTCLRIIAGLEEPDEGKVYIGDKDVTDLKPRERNIAMVFQSFALYPHMSAGEIIGFPLEARGVPKEEREKKVKEVAELLEIEELLDRKPSNLSGGQAQRVALGRAIIRDPDVFLMDEPLANLDAKLRHRMRGEVKQLQRDLGVATVFVTHDQSEAMGIADRIVLLKDGEIKQVGEPEDLYRNPKNLFVATFIGSPRINTIDAAGKIENDELKVSPSGESHPESFTPTIDYDLDTIGNEGLVFGVRPEKCNLSEEPKEISLKGEVTVIEPLGKEKEITLDVNGETFRVLESAEKDFEVGKEYWIVFDQMNYLLFDKESGKNIGY